MISAKHSNRYVQFAAQGSWGMRAETTSNRYLEKSEQLSRSQIAALKEAGWQAPTRTMEDSTPENDPDGSPNFFIEFPARRSFKAVADLAICTLAEILRVPHPGYLEYDAFDADGATIELPGLGLKRRMPPRDAEKAGDLPQQLLEAVKNATGLDDLDYDEDGDLGFRSGSAVVFVRLAGHPAFVRFCSPLLTDCKETPALFARLNEMNAGRSHLRLFAIDRKIFAVAEVPAEPFVGEHVGSMLHDFCQITNGLDSLLQTEFGGKTAFFPSMASSLRH